MKKIISFLLLAAMLVGCMIPAVIVSAADTTIVAESVEKLQGTGTAVAPKITLENNPGIYSVKLVVYYDKTQLAKSDADAFAGSVFGSDSAVGSQRAGSHKDLKNYVPADLQSTSAGFVVDLMGTYDEDLGDTTVVTDNGLAVTLPLEIVATEYGTFTYNVVVADAYDADGNELEIADVSGTVTYAPDPLIGIYDEFTVFTDPGDVDVTIGTDTIDVDIRFDNNPGLWSTRMFIVYPAGLTLSDGAETPAAKVDNPYIIYTEPSDMITGIPDIALDDPRQPASFQDIMKADPSIVKEGYHSTTVYFEPAAYDAVIPGNGVLCTLHFDIADDVEVGDVLDIRMYYGMADFLYAGTEADGKTPIFISYYPPVLGSDITIVEKVCEHKTTTTEHLDATCGVAGYDRVVCTDECGKVLEETPIPATGNHTEGEAVIEESTCIEAGKEVYNCSVCGDYIREVALGLADHTPGDAATCQAAQICTVCGTELVAKLAHVEGEAEVTNPSCTEDGKRVYNCAGCGEYIREEAIPATGHTYLNPGSTKIVSPTCTESGYKSNICDVCGDETVVETTPAWGHDEDGEVVIVESTCTVAGTKTTHCDMCGEVSKVEELPLAAHTLEYIEGFDAYCHTDGIVDFWVCVECLEVFADAEGTQVVEYLEDLIIEAENDLVYVPGAEACHVPGIEEYWYCPACDSVYADAEGLMLTNRKDLEIPADCELVHMEKVEACHANGTEEYWFCPECEAVYADAEGTILTNRMNLTIPADAEAKHVEAVAATCTENGMAEYWYCEECDTFFSDAECKYPVAYLSLTTLATGHDYENGVCKICGDKEVADNEDNKNQAPVTGDNMIFIVIALAVVLVAGAAVVIFRRKRSAN